MAKPVPTERDLEMARELLPWPGLWENYLPRLAAGLAAARDEGRREERERWQPIETAPSRQDLLVFEPDHYEDGSPFIGIDWRDSDGLWMAGGNPTKYTHWQPLAQAPKCLIARATAK